MSWVKLRALHVDGQHLLQEYPVLSLNFLEFLKDDLLLLRSRLLCIVRLEVFDFPRLQLLLNDGSLDRLYPRHM